MNETTGSADRGVRNDSLAELVRAGGRRTTPPRADHDYVLRAATAAWQGAVRAKRQRQWIGALAAGVVLCAVGLASLQLRPVATPPMITFAANLTRGELEMQRPGDFDWRRLPMGAALINGARLRASGPVGACISLSTGGFVRVKSSTELTLMPGARLQLIAGDVYVDSGARAPAEPVVVETALGVVRDVGTVFMVRVSPEAMSVRVREGKILLDTGSSTSPLEGNAGEEWRVHTDETSQLAQVSTSGADWAWAEALATAPVVNGKTLLGFLEWVAHESGRALEFQGTGVKEQAAAVLLHGSVPDVQPLDALEMMLAATDFEYSLSDAGAIVIQRRAF